jgi:RIO-like serine/threonine protein kinase
MKMKIIQKGKWGNSDVYIHEHDSKKYVVKTFAHHPVLIRNTIGRLLIAREYKALKRLAPCIGTCDDAIRLGKYTLSYKYVKGQNLSSFSRRNHSIGKDFFPNFERAVKEMHSYGIVHLDIRTGSNIIISEDKKPIIIDFQSYLTLDFIPGQYLKNLFKSVDISGVYKYWMKMRPDTLEESKKEQLAVSNKNRKLWFLKGYMIERHIKNKKKKIIQNQIKNKQESSS